MIQNYNNFSIQNIKSRKICTFCKIHIYLTFTNTKHVMHLKKNYMYF